MLQDATRWWRSTKATKQTRTRRSKTFKCCKMLLEEIASNRDHRARLVSSNRECFAHYKHISYFFNKYSLSLYVYTRGLLGCLLGFWPLDYSRHAFPAFSHWSPLPGDGSVICEGFFCIVTLPTPSHPEKPSIVKKDTCIGRWIQNLHTLRKENTII